jgi:hypothetical protein
MPDQFRVDLTYRLAGPNGRTPDTHRKAWYFDLPTVDWDELLHRVFYDANVGMRRREPRDDSWLALDDYGRPPPSAARPAAHPPRPARSGSKTSPDPPGRL